MLVKGQKINDRYEIVKTIGEGGMANVYLANDIILNRKVAVKVLRGDLAGDEKFIRRFQREALSVSNLSHPNIVEVYDVGEEDGNHYIVMEYIEGSTLKKLIQKRGALTLPEVRDIMLQLTDGLAHAHDAYIIHRDIKPQNIMILDNGLVKITDFGIAVAMNATQLTQTNSVMGSVHYLPPEQANGKAATIKSDIYSLGILMFELLTGSVPFKGDNAVEIALKHMKEKIPSVRKINPVIPQSVENIILKATAKNPKNRYDDVREMYKDLEVCLEKENEKRYVYPYPETDLEETKVLNDLKNFGIRGPESVAYVGGNAKMNEFQAAMGICNLRHINEEIEKRRHVINCYRDYLNGVSGIKLKAEQPYVETNCAYFPVVFDGYKYSRDEVFDKLRKEGINARKYFYPLTNDAECYMNTFPSGEEQTPIAKYISDRVLTLPLYGDLDGKIVEKICKVILK